MLSPECINRLYNFKFLSANEMLEEESPTEDEKNLVEALAIFGNPGWFLGGQMEVIINGAIKWLESENPGG